MAIEIFTNEHRKLVVISNALSDKPEDLIRAVAAKCKLRSVEKLLIANDPLFPAWRIALIALKPYLKPGVEARIIDFSFHGVNRMRSSERNRDPVKALL